MKIPLLYITPVCLFTTLLSAHAAILVTWDFNGASPGTGGTIVDTTGSVASVANVIATNASITRNTGNITNLPAGGNTGSGLSYIAPYEAGTAGPNPNTGFLVASGFGTSPNSGNFVTFSLNMSATIDPTVSQLQGIQFNLANSGTSGPRGVEVTYRIGTSGIFTSLGTTAVPTNVANQYGLFTFNLASPISLSASDVVTFRLLGYADSVSNSIRFDNVSITAIPEPATWSLLAGGLASLVVFRRRNIS